MNLFIERKPPSNVSSAVYETLDPIGLFQSMRLLVISAVLFVSFYLIFLGGEAFAIIDQNLAYFIATYSVAIIYFIIIYRTDKYEREPLRFILFIFAWGGFSGVFAATLNEIIGPLFQASLGNASLSGAITEEPLKAAGLYYLVTRERFRDEFNTPLDGIVYGFAAGMGFFAVENFIYFLSPEIGGTGTLVMRSFLLWGHGVWVATTGLWLGLAKIQRGYIRRWDLVPGLLVAITMHFLWNGWGGFLGNDLGFIAQIAQLVFQFWYMRKILREALRDETIWGYNQGLAPKE
jgi:RsiW-degrading membrane proteinase PrsW (M82 family)